MINKVIRLAKALTAETVKRLPYIIVVGLLIGLPAFVISYNRTAQAVRIAKENSDHIATQTAAIRDNTAAIGRSVKSLKADNEQQTKILCRLILRGDVTLTNSEALQVEAICKEAIAKGNAEATAQQQNKSATSGTQSSGSTTTTKHAGSSNNGNDQQPKSPQPSLVQQAQNLLKKFIRL